MEKINKDELMKKLNLTEEELEKVAGGDSVNYDTSCFMRCLMKNINKGKEPHEANEICIEACLTL